MNVKARAFPPIEDDSLVISVVHKSPETPEKHLPIVRRERILSV